MTESIDDLTTRINDLRDDHETSTQEALMEGVMDNLALISRLIDAQAKVVAEFGLLEARVQMLEAAE
jgi:hypothetical protein